jgi:hypothetical protein
MADSTAREVTRDGAAPKARGRAEAAGCFAGELERSLTVAERRAIRRDVVSLLLWQKDLAHWRTPGSRVSAWPYVALYVRGRLYGCFGAEEGKPGERLARAFLSAAHDGRFGGLPEGARSDLSAEVSYVRGVRSVNPEELERVFEPGIHGLAVVRPKGRAVILLPSVARDNGLRARGMLEALVRKARVQVLEAERFFAFETEQIVVRMREGKMPRISWRDAAAAWLARLVQRDGSVLFGIDARTGAPSRTGEMHHARAAAAVQALDVHGGYPTEVRRARERLARDARDALAGNTVEAWPDHPAKVAGTLAHLVRAGVDVKEALLAMALSHDVALTPWHAGQVAAALGPLTPASLLATCIKDLDRRPWAPWTVLAGSRCDRLFARHGEAWSRAVTALVTSVRKEAPHRGGVGVTEVPEVALTALTVEALRGVRGTYPVRAAIERGAAFVQRWQIMTERAPAAFDLKASVGAFVGSPVSNGLRADVTGHALLALG